MEIRSANERKDEIINACEELYLYGYKILHHYNLKEIKEQKIMAINGVWTFGENKYNAYFAQGFSKQPYLCFSK